MNQGRKFIEKIVQHHVEFKDYVNPILGSLSSSEYTNMSLIR